MTLLRGSPLAPFLSGLILLPPPSAPLLPLHPQVLFSNVRECREVSRSFYSALEERRRESTVCRNVRDIIMDYVSGLLAPHVHCYVAACTEVQWSMCVCSNHY